MLPPVLEIYVVWHPGDLEGKRAAEQFLAHFHGTPFTGLIGGAVEVYVRSEGWRSADDAPRPIPFPNAPPPNGVAQAQLTAVVPMLGIELAKAVEPGTGGWYDYAMHIAKATSDFPGRVRVFPLQIDSAATDGTKLGQIFGPFQQIATRPLGTPPDEPDDELRCRDLAQGIAQFAGVPGERLTVFISHTKRAGISEESEILDLIDRVRSIILRTRLREFFDAKDLQPSELWDEELRAQAASSAMLALRTDLYSSREWCQREMVIAKREGMPIVMLDALSHGEERGSFLMDHVPRVPARHEGDHWRDADIRLGLNLLVDECLKRALWRRQAQLGNSRKDLGISWWAPHAPEPTTLAAWLESERKAGRSHAAGTLRILHPDPPLGPEEKFVLDQITGLGHPGPLLDIMTPRQLAARGG